MGITTSFSSEILRSAGADLIVESFAQFHSHLAGIFTERCIFDALHRAVLSSTTYKSDSVGGLVEPSQDRSMD